MPTINPLLINSTPLGNEPLMVNPGVPVLLLPQYIPEPIVATTLTVPSQPALIARVRRLGLVWLLLIASENWLALP
jgi:hypothetical protein